MEMIAKSQLQRRKGNGQENNIQKASSKSLKALKYGKIASVGNGKAVFFFINDTKQTSVHTIFKDKSLHATSLT